MAHNNTPAAVLTTIVRPKQAGKWPNQINSMSRDIVDTASTGESFRLLNLYLFSKDMLLIVTVSKLSLANSPGNTATKVACVSDDPSTQLSSEITKFTDILQQADMRAADTPECIRGLKKTRSSQQRHYQAYYRHAHTPRAPSTSRSYCIDWASLDKPSVHLSGCPTIFQRRLRSHSAPSVPNTLSAFPFSHRTLLPSSEHCEDRIRALKDGE
nr:hypothetical protein L204_01579 [Cryptococcus depauperatus CBS 7855]